MATARLITPEEKAMRAAQEALPPGTAIDFSVGGSSDGSASEETTEPTALDTFLGYFKTEAGDYDLVRVGGGVAVAALAVYAVRRVF